MNILIKKEKKVFILLLLMLILSSIFRFYQIINLGGYLEFDLFSWAKFSKDIILSGNVPNILPWAFPLFNSIVSLITGVDLLNLYRVMGSFLTLLGIFIFYLIGKHFLNSVKWGLILAFFYSLLESLIPRSIMYLPETLTYIIGPSILLSYLFLLKFKKTINIFIFLLLSGFYFHLHQTGYIFFVLSFFMIIFFIVTNNDYYNLVKKKYIVIISLIYLLFVILGNKILPFIMYLLNKSGGKDALFNTSSKESLLKVISQFPLILLIVTVIGFFVAIFSIMNKVKTKEYRFFIFFSVIISFIFFCFVYLFPKINLYTFVPWRFYPWLGLYLIILALVGTKEILIRINPKIISIIIFFMIIAFIPEKLIFDDMVVLDDSTIISFQNIDKLNGGRNIITTTTNNLPTKFFLDRDNSIISGNFPRIFLANNPQEAYKSFQSYVEDGKINKTQNNYILISLFQLKQKPKQYAWWKYRAYPQMDKDIFLDKNYFLIEYQDENLLLVKIK